MAAYTYIVECADGTLYTGWTTDLQNRVAAHNLGTGAKYTSGRAPVKLVYFEEYADKKTAQQREHSIKRLPREKKKALLAAFSPSQQDNA
jgi:putative endonuclease